MPSRHGFKLTQKQKPPIRRWLRGLLVAMGLTGVFSLAAAGTGAYLLYQHFVEALPDISQLKSSGPSGLLGFVLFPLGDADAAGCGQLHLYNPVTGKLIEVSGLDGKPLEPLH